MMPAASKASAAHRATITREQEVMCLLISFQDLLKERQRNAMRTRGEDGKLGFAVEEALAVYYRAEALHSEA